MISYEETRSIEGTFADSNPLETVVEFYRVNGYELRDLSESEDGRRRHAVLERGERSLGWWSSNTTSLPTRVEARYADGELELSYAVDKPGQPLTENDRKFWRREMRAAANQARNPLRRPTDLRHEAAKRAEQLRRRLLSYAIWGILSVMIFVVVVNVFSNGGSP